LGPQEEKNATEQKLIAVPKLEQVGGNRWELKRTRASESVGQAETSPSGKSTQLRRLKGVRIRWQGSGMETLVAYKKPYLTITERSLLDLKRYTATTIVLDDNSQESRDLGMENYVPNRHVG
jgi:hypothetical protein